MYILFSIFVFFLLFVFYFYIHKILVANDSKIISGLGFMALPFLLILGYLLQLEIPIKFLTLILIPSFIYLMDDLISINFKLRIFLQLISGLIIYLMHFNLENFTSDYYLLLICMFSSIVLINSLNFNDGSNGNIAIIILQFLIWFWLIDNSNIYNDLIFLLIIFIILFLILNFLNVAYFGDSGCFLFSIIFLYMIFDKKINNIYILMLPLIFYLIDVFYVLALRVKRKENLLSRNYHHLYQILNKYNSVMALLPGLFNNLLLFFLFYLIKPQNLLVFLCLSVVISLIIYIFIRNLLIMTNVK